jgi:acyl-[acyl-carrier-protein]-phospholipid O-acyltransferase/long-chain-fatty-acid--[acyl-carrier-protein] ligase
VFLWGFLAAILPHQELMNILAPKTHRNVFATAVLLFSSGSTGSPKGVMLSHHNINSNVYSFYRIMGWDKNTDSILGNLPLFHSFGMTTCFWVPLMTGTKVVYVTNPLDAAATGKAIQEHGIRILLATPTFLQMYMRKCTGEQFKSLRLVVVGAEKLRADIATKFKEMTGLIPLEGYGCTELSPVVSINISNSILSLGTEAGKHGSVGMPMPGICVKITDPDTGKELPPNKEGLLLVKGPTVMQGYLGDPEKTAEAIKDGWYNTGDIAKVDPDDRITITGRLSRFSKIAGEMVPHELVENEIQTLLDTDTRTVAVSGAPDESKGEKLIVFHTEINLTPEEIIGKLREKELPNLWIPKAENFRKIESFPLLGSGKLDLAALKKMA